MTREQFYNIKVEEKANEIINILNNRKQKDEKLINSVNVKCFCINVEELSH